MQMLTRLFFFQFGFHQLFLQWKNVCLLLADSALSRSIKLVVALILSSTGRTWAYTRARFKLSRNVGYVGPSSPTASCAGFENDDWVCPMFCSR